jgi:hypothetical protein
MDAKTVMKSLTSHDVLASKYLEGAIKLGCRSSAIFSFLISLYVVMTDEEPLYKFLSAHVLSASVASEAFRKEGLNAYADDWSA